MRGQGLQPLFPSQQAARILLASLFTANTQSKEERTKGSLRSSSRRRVKHLQLAAFVAGRGEGEPWRNRMRAWNRKHPKERYGQESNFRRDALQAQKRLLGPTITWVQVAEMMVEVHGSPSIC